MARNVRVVIHSKGARALLSSSEVQGDLNRRAQSIADTAGEGFEAEVTAWPARARAGIWTRTTEAKLAEAHDRALTRALDAGRG